MKIFQIYFEPEQLDKIDSCCIAYDNSNDTSREYEYRVMKEIYETNQLDNYTGVLSWRFNTKTHLQVSHFKKLIENNCGYDCYCVNPYKDFISYFGNVWKQGECHKGITSIAQDIFDRAGYNIHLAAQVHTLERSTYCNYWIANKEFWKRYMDFSIPIYNTMKELSDYQEILFNEYGKGYFPYIMERVFTTFTHYDKEMKVKVF